MRSQQNTPSPDLMFKTINLKPLIRNLSFFGLLVLSFAVTNANAQLKPSFDSAKGPTLLAGSNPSLSKGSTYIYQNVASSTDGIVDAIVTITDLHHSSVKGVTIDQIISNNSRFEPVTNVSKSGGYVEWQVKFVLDGTVNVASDEGVPAYVDSITLEAIDVDGDEFFEAIVTNSYTLEGGSSPRTDLSVSNKSGYTRFQSGHNSSNDIDSSKTQYIVRINYKNVNTIKFRNGRANFDEDDDRSDRQNSISFLGEVTFNSNRTTVLNVAPVVQDKTGNTTEVNTRFDIDLLNGATDVDGNLERSSVKLIAPNNVTNQGSSGNPLVIAGVGTYTVDKHGELRFTPFNGYQGPANIWFTVSDKLGVSSDRATLGLNVAAGADATNSTISSAASLIIADGVSTTIITVQAIDSNGNNLTIGGDTVVLNTTAGTLSAVTDNGNGTYSAVLTSATTAGTATITGTLNSVAMADNATVNFTSGSASTINSTISAADPAIEANGVSTTTVTIQTIDANGNNLTSGGDTVVLNTTAGTLSAVTDNGNGTYSAVLTSATTAGTATITGTLNSVAMADNATVNFTSGSASTINSTISAADPAIEANGVSTTTITIQTIDANGNNLTSGGDVVVLSTTSGTLSAVTDNGNGTYSAVLTSATTAGTATITGTLNSVAMADNVTVDFTSGKASAINSTISAADSAIVADGKSKTAITVQAIDSEGSDLVSGGDTVILSTNAGSLSAVTDNDDGTYSAILSSTLTETTATITGTLNSVAMSDSASVIFTPSIADATSSVLSASLNTIVADGLTQSLITLQAVNANGINLNVGGDTVVIESSAGSISVTNDNGDGTYSATLTSATEPSDATVSAKLNAAPTVSVVDIGFVARPTVVTQVTQSKTPTLTGTVTTFAGVTFTVSVDGKSYVPNDGNLSVNGTNWTLVIPATNPINVGTYPVTASIVDSATQLTDDISTNELTVEAQLLSISLNIGAGPNSTNTPSYPITGSCVAIGNSINVKVTDTNVDSVEISGIACTDDGAGQGKFATTVNLSDLADGNLAILATITNLSGVSNSQLRNVSKDVCSPDNTSSLCDSDADGIPDGVELQADTNPTNSDSDEDGIPDGEEFGRDPFNPVDTDGDGIIDALDADSDNDGIPDVQENGTNNNDTPLDSDDDGIPNYRDTDSDNDGISDAIEYANANADADGDMIPDYLDSDSDNDGIPDALESGLFLGTDSDSDAIDDGIDVDITGGFDANNDGIDDNLRLRDTDGDAIPDTSDIDSDNDGIPDSVEADLTLIPDSDLDGIKDIFDVDITGGNDANNDGIDDNAAVLITDTDGDGLPDYRDLDTDNDGSSDVVEAGGTDIAPEDALIDNFEVTQGTLQTPLDTDSDNIPDYRDLESTNPANDGTGPFDIATRDDSPTLDTDNDGVVDSVTGVSNDNDHDGILDPVDPNDFIFGSLTDLDLDGTPDGIDLDDDNDGIPNIQEGNGLVDTDGDGVPDSMDLDSDNDGIHDVLEADNGRVDVDQNGRIDEQIDLNNDGFDDNISINMIPVDTDNDAVPDFRDLDSDDDGIFDLIESLDPSLNPSLIDANNDGRVDKLGVDGQPKTINKAIDFDNDGKPDFRDLDSDNDGFDDKYEVGDFDGDGKSDRLENSGGIKTAVRGAGAFGIELGLLILLTIGTLIQRTRPFNNRLHLLLFVILPFMFSSQLKADDAELCGYRLADSDQRILKEDEGNIASDFSSCFYGGLALGLSHIKPEGESNGWSTNDSKDWGWKALIGQHFAPHWFWEFSYSDQGEAGLSNRNPLLTALIPDANINYHVPAFMAGYWFRDEYQPINVYIKAGLSVISNEASDSRIGFEEQTSVQLALGAGVQYRFDDSAWFTRLELDSYDKDARMLTLQIGRYLGGPDKREPVVEPIPVAPIVAVADSDKDGIIDANDQCPQTYPGAAVDSNGCELDHDKDRVVDRLDQCPRTPIGHRVLNNGCSKVKLGVLHGVNFKSNSVELTSEAVSVLNDLVRELTRVPDVHVQIQAHTDSRGSSAYNQQLSEKRAKSVLNYLVSKGIDSQRLTSIGVGESRPIANNATTDGRQKNRRVEIHAINQ